MICHLNVTDPVPRGHANALFPTNHTRHCQFVIAYSRPTKLTNWQCRVGFRSDQIGKILYCKLIQQGLADEVNIFEEIYEYGARPWSATRDKLRTSLTTRVGRLWQTQSSSVADLTTIISPSCSLESSANLACLLLLAVWINLLAPAVCWIYLESRGLYHFHHFIDRPKQLIIGIKIIKRDCCVFSPIGHLN